MSLNSVLKSHPVFLVEHLGPHVPEELDQTPGRHHDVWRTRKHNQSTDHPGPVLWSSSSTSSQYSSVHGNRGAGEGLRRVDWLLSLWVLYWARSRSRSSLMASGHRAATSLMAFRLQDQKHAVGIIIISLGVGMALGPKSSILIYIYRYINTI